jgi:hypothetical protein
MLTITGRRLRSVPRNGRDSGRLSKRRQMELPRACEPEDGEKNINLKRVVYQLESLHNRAVRHAKINASGPSKSPLWPYLPGSCKRIFQTGPQRKLPF